MDSSQSLRDANYSHGERQRTPAYDELSAMELEQRLSKEGFTLRRSSRPCVRGSRSTNTLSVFARPMSRSAARQRHFNVAKELLYPPHPKESLLARVGVGAIGNPRRPPADSLWHKWWQPFRPTEYYATGHLVTLYLLAGWEVYRWKRYQTFITLRSKVVAK